MKAFPPYNTLEEAVFATVVYLDLFDFSPTVQEVQKWLLKFGDGREQPTLSAIQAALASDSRITHKEGMYFLATRQNGDMLPNLRKQKYNYTEAKWRHARPYLRLLSWMPFVRSIWLSNSMAWHNTQRTSDIDIVIVASPGHIWTARFFTTLMMKFLRQRPGQQRPSKAICLSFYLTQDKLNLSAYRTAPSDIHYAFWCTQMYPIYGVDVYTKYTQSNQWLFDLFHNIQWTIPSSVRIIRLSTLEHVLQLIAEFVLRSQYIERFLQRLQWRILPSRIAEMANQDTRVMLQETILKLHTNDRRKAIQARFSAAMEAHSQRG